MTENDHTVVQVTDREIATMRQNLNMIRTQVQSGRVDGVFLSQQLDRMTDLLGRLELEHRLLKKEGRFEALYNVSRLIGSSLDLQTVLDQVMDASIQLTGAERGFLMLRDDDGQLKVKAARNLDQQTITGEKFAYSRTIVNKVMDSGSAVVTTNAAEDPRFANQASIIGQALRSIMATPLRARGTVIGVIYVDNRIMTGLFDNDDLAALDALGAQAAVAIDNARLFSTTDQQLAARLEELTQLRRIDQQLNESLDPTKAMMVTLEGAARVTGASVGHLGLVQHDDGLHIVSVHHYGITAHDTQPLYLEKMYPGTIEAAQKGQSQIVAREGESLLIVPVRREESVVAVMVLRREGAFSEEQRAVVERVVTRAAIAIENARLYEQVKAADRAKSEFVGVVAHDLKTPMTSIVGYADLTRMDDNLSERQQEFIGRIKDTVRRMEMLVSDLADISRIESGHFYMTPRRVSVDEITQGVRDNTFPQIRERGHAWVERVEPNLPDMHADYYRLLQVLTNLVSNAYKYTPNGGTLTLSIYRQEDRIAFSVSDTGIGLSKEAIGKLGTKFWRSEDDFTRSQPGTGLGFAITRGLIEQMGSRVQIDSVPGMGSTFSFSIAIAKDDAS